MFTASVVLVVGLVADVAADGVGGVVTATFATAGTALASGPERGGSRVATASLPGLVVHAANCAAASVVTATFTAPPARVTL